MLTVAGLRYVGVTVRSRATALASVRERVAKHFYRAHREQHAWRLCAALRSLARKEDIGCAVLEVVRGKAAAHRREVELRRALQPELNTDCRGDRG